MRYPCTRRRRLTAVAQAGLLNGIEYLEVHDTEEPVQALRQRTLFVRLLLPPTLDAANHVTGLAVVIEGGERITGIGVEWLARGDHLPPGTPAALVAGLDDLDRLLVVRTDARGDFSPYRLRIVAGPGTSAPPADVDPLLAEVEFSFKVECPSDFDCAPVDDCPPEPHTAPAIDYLAKDYQGFRRLMLERMALLAPEWTERNPADDGVALVEMLAYVADELSYRQDAVTTEAYLGTARSRVSLRRHARLVDYRIGEGCSARAWVQVRVDSAGIVLPAGTRLITRVPGLEPRIVPDSPADRTSREARPTVFETSAAATLDVDLNDLRFYTWGELGCCLPRGATAATLRGHHPTLHPGDVLVLGEQVSPTTRRAEDADPS
ncbi:hypothetical protein, partial [Kribbia dieselivorans]|uniref:hypothetical protein n=1 Tax=Kribbia dieselivorans TaxID=331526 RepID=UPI000A807747